MSGVKSDPNTRAVLVPALDDRAAFAVLVKRLAAAAPDAFIVVADDGSMKAPVEAADIAEAGVDGVVLHLERNLGHQRAILTGLNWIMREKPGASVIVMDSDGEDDPADIPRLLEAMESSAADAVVAERVRRSVPFWFRMFLRLYYAFFWVLTGMRLRHGNFSALSPAAALRVARMDEAWSHYGAAILSARLDVARITIDRAQRIEGRSRMSLTSLVVHGMRSIIVFADRVLARATLFAAGLGAVCAALLVVAAVIKLWGAASPGWFTAAAGLLTVMMIQSAVLALLAVVLAAAGRSAAPPARPDVLALIERVEPARPDGYDEKAQQGRGQT